MPELLCPVCGAVLAREEKLDRCPVGHSFDRGRGGYVNLLVSRQSGAQHGDDKAMVRARREFLEGGWYAPLRRALCAAAVENAPAGETVDLLDAGCGECYYTAAVTAALKNAGRRVSAVGVDISRDALRWGGKRAEDIALAVASVFRLPVAAESCDLILNVFAPFAGAEFARVLRPGGALVQVSPDGEHLWELKAAVYETPRRNDAAAPAAEGLRLERETRVTYPLELTRNEDIRNLFQMTPYAHKTSPEDAARLEALDRLTVQAAFVLRIYRRA